MVNPSVEFLDSPVSSYRHHNALEIFWDGTRCNDGCSDMANREQMGFRFPSPFRAFRAHRGRNIPAAVSTNSVPAEYAKINKEAKPGATVPAGYRASTAPSLSPTQKNGRGGSVSTDPEKLMMTAVFSAIFSHMKRSARSARFPGR